MKAFKQLRGARGEATGATNQSVTIPTDGTNDGQVNILV